MRDDPQTTEKRDILERLELLESGRSRPFDPDLNFYVVAADAIAEIKRLRRVNHDLMDRYARLLDQLGATDA